MMKFLTTMVFAFFCVTASAQIDEIKDLPGYIDFGELSSVYGSPKVRINIGKRLLKFVTAMAKNNDEEGARLLAKLEAVRVEVYEMNDDADAAIDVIKEVSEQLSEMEWEPVVIVEDGKDQARIFVKLEKDDTTLSGLVVMAVDKKDEAVFINIIGDIDPAQVGKVTKALDIDIDI